MMQERGDRNNTPRGRPVEQKESTKSVVAVVVGSAYKINVLSTSQSFDLSEGMYQSVESPSSGSLRATMTQQAIDNKQNGQAIDNKQATNF